MTRQAVTKHLKLLEEATPVVTIWRSREKLHYLNAVPIHEVAERWIGKYERGRLRAFAELKKKLEEKPMHENELTTESTVYVTYVTSSRRKYGPR
jgi:hypothetical protein